MIEEEKKGIVSTITTQMDLGKLFPPKAKLTIPFYYSYSSEHVRPKYNPLDSDMLLDDALDAAASKHERDSILDLTTRRQTTKNIAFTGVKLNIQSRKHPMPYDPANFTFNYSHSHTYNTGETTVYEHDKAWRGSINYSWSPNWKAWEPFKNIKSKSKWLQVIKDQGWNLIPQNISFNTDMVRTYYEIQERDLDNLEGKNTIPVRWTPTFLWNREFSLRWDFTKTLHFNFQSATHAEIEEPYTPVNKDLYPDRYEAWKDSVLYSIRHLGTPLDYAQSAQVSYKFPFEKIPATDWISADGTYQSNYNWKRGAEYEDGTNLGNTINMQRTVNVNGKFNLETLYNHSPFLKEANKRFSTSTIKSEGRKKDQAKKKAKDAKKKEEATAAKARMEAEQKAAAGDSTALLALNDPTKAKAQTNAKGVSQQKEKLFKGFAGEVQLVPDSAVELKHGQKSKRILVSAKDEKGKVYPIKYKRVDENTIRIQSPGDSIKLRVNVLAKPKAQDQKWYQWAQAGARFAMMLRNVSVSYRNTYSLALPGFMPNIGDAFGQKKTNGFLSPGLDFAFGLVNDNYINTAKERGWLLNSDSVATPATTNTSEDIQIKATLEPLPDLKIDLNASRTRTRSKSIQYMYSGNPTTQTGSFNMTTITIRTAFKSRGDASNGYDSEPFRRFQDYLPEFQRRVEARYAGIQYPEGTGLSGTYNPANGAVDMYSADVMVPAFLAAYSGRRAGDSPLDIFPSLLHVLPNWTITYKGLSNLPWIRDHFKNVTLTHGYKSIYSVGSYNTYSSWVEYMHGSDMGFVKNETTGEYQPSSMYDISTVSINESFSPLIGLNVTMNNNMTFKLEYRKTRVLTLSMTAAQINEASSEDIVFGWGYKLTDFKLGSLWSSKSSSQKAAKKNNRGRTRNQKDDDKSKTSTSSKETGKSNFAHSLNLRLDFSYRSQDAITRNIQTSLSEATMGNRAFKTSFACDYSMSRYVTFSLYYDRQRNEPLLSSSAYPTITQDFGFNLRFTLTR